MLTSRGGASITRYENKTSRKPTFVGFRLLRLCGGGNLLSYFSFASASSIDLSCSSSLTFFAFSDSMS